MHIHRLRRNQSGFIQNFIIPGIILIGVVIAGIAMLSTGSSSSTDNEKASMLANAVMAQGISLGIAIHRSESDGAIAPDDAGDIDLDMRLVGPKYIAAVPKLQAEISDASSVWTYSKNDHAALVGGATHVGTSAKDDMLFMPVDGPAKEAVCLRINNKLYGTSTLSGTATGGNYSPGVSVSSPTGAPAGATEGCILTGSDYLYYKVLNIK